MSDDSSAIGAIEWFYDEGNIDDITFPFVTGYVTYDKDDVSFGKSDDQIFNDAILLTRFFVDSGDFEPWTWSRNIAENRGYSPYPGGLEQFCKDALADYRLHELIYFVDHSMKYMLKKTEIVKPPPTEIPDEILKIFQSA
jgi:hypothetical protein